MAEDEVRRRDDMVLQQIKARGIRDQRVLQVMREIPRHLFVPPEHQAMAYEDMPLPIGCEQTISQPLMVALMTEALQLRGGERVLEIGTGSGYQAAILGRLSRVVFSIERIPDLAARARTVLAALGLSNVHVLVGDGTLGLPEHAPYDAIVVTAGAPYIPQPLTEQLAPDGRLVIPVGDRVEQVLTRVTRTSTGQHTEQLGSCRFVPLIGRGGWVRAEEESPSRP